jgi:RNA polymerase sigma factor (sigma-70 family)
VFFKLRVATIARTDIGSYMMSKSDLWAEYARVQQGTEWGFLSDRTEAAEDALGVILEKARAGQTISSSQVNNLLINRAKTARHRRFLLARNAPLLNRSANEEQRFMDRLALHQCLRTCEVRDQRILQLVAAGYDYSYIAAKENVSESAIKTRIHRARLKLKRSASQKASGRRLAWPARP